MEWRIARDTGARIGVANELLCLYTDDEPGYGGANHRYLIEGMEYARNPVADEGQEDLTVLVFQNGPIPEVGVNGLTHEVLLAIVTDRLRGFQKGPYGCKENAYALTHIEEAMHWLQQRTIARIRRDVEGTHTV